MSALEDGIQSSWGSFAPAVGCVGRLKQRARVHDVGGGDAGADGLGQVDHLARGAIEEHLELVLRVRGRRRAGLLERRPLDVLGLREQPLGGLPRVARDVVGLRAHEEAAIASRQTSRKRPGLQEGELLSKRELQDETHRTVSCSPIARRVRRARRLRQWQAGRQAAGGSSLDSARLLSRCGECCSNI